MTPFIGELLRVRQKRGHYPMLAIVLVSSGSIRFCGLQYASVELNI
jgi:hypothetical protein